MFEPKYCHVEVKPIGDGPERWHFVHLQGVPVGETLRPRHARQAVNQVGVHPGKARVRVWSWDKHGYAVYPETSRKITRDWLYNDEVVE